MSVTTWFQTFNNKLRMSDETVENITYRYKRMTKQLNKDFWSNESETSNSLYVGSYGRGTEIHTSDIDMLFKLPYSYYEKYNNHAGNGQSALLQAIKASIGKTYKSYMRADGQVVKIDFTDKINFELVPCFINKDGKSFTYPDTNNGGTWKVTNPRAEMDEITTANNMYNRNLKRLCRMARAWKDNWDVPMGGLLIDTLAYNFLKDYVYKDKSYTYYDLMSRDFFSYLKDLPRQDYWLAVGSKHKVYTKGDFQYKALRCYNISIEAIEKEKFESTAKSKWREIYGTRFPA